MNTTAAPGSIPNHLAWAIIATVLATCLCCPLGLLGIVAIVQSNKVNTLLNQGDMEGARRASASAKTWCWVATALAILGVLINVGLLATGGMASYVETMQQLQNR
jgi:hypothetical protein